MANLKSAEELSQSLKKKLRMEGHTNGLKLVKLFANEDIAREVIQKIEQLGYTKMSVEDTLALIVSRRFSKRDFKAIRSSALSQNCKLYPSYQEVKYI